MKLSKPSLLFFILLSGISLFFIFSKLSDYPLWQDEANAALLGKNILRFGVPQVFDGANFIAYKPSDAGSDHVWHLWGWLPLYINAFFYWLSGPDTFWARFPHALLGFLFCLSFFLILKSRHRDDLTAPMGALMMVFCVPLLLCFRQCQYYSFSIALTFLLFILSFPVRDKKINPLFILISFLLFNVHFLSWFLAYGSCFLTAGTEALFHLYSGKGPFKKESGNASFPALKNLSILLLGGIINLYPFYFYRIDELREDYATGSLHQSLASIFFPQFEYHFKLISAAILPFPLILFALIIVLLVLSRKKTFPPLHSLLRPVFFSVFYIAFSALASRMIYFRYIIPVVPVLFYALARFLAVLIKNSFRTGIAATLLIGAMAIGNIHLSQDGTLYSMLLQFGYEITHDNEDVNEILVNYLNKNARKSDTVLTNYGAFPIIYYTGLTVGGGESAYRLKGFKQPVPVSPILEPDWVIIRKGWNLYNDELKKIVTQGHYTKIELPAVDTKWGNRESPFSHHFITPVEGPRLEIFKKS